ncbi:OmpA family protein [Pedobacter mucosus]|uniref:OmpA family protein n=1 Tax=Pedobacter mucosus TaxID=2895286 RepID=UPI001EE3B991|nr:OmpA family protein [Pedobacter mucosus]UKT64491.1 OmpA family protein [Pedobacter mucosus]
MKKIAIAATLGMFLFSCNSKNKTEENVKQKTETPASDTTKKAATSALVNWEEMPDLKAIGNFPFITAPQGLKINDEKDGLSEVFDYETMQNYTGQSVYTTEGKLGILSFDGESGKNFNQKLFDKSVYDYFDQIGAKKLYQGDFPKDENDQAKLEKNMWSGKHRTSGLMRESDAPFAVYAFKNNGKNYMVNIQSNSAQGSIFIMELQEFKQTIKKYSAAQMKADIDQSGKAILNINFDTDKATLQPDGDKIVEEIFALLRANPNLKLSIEGHTDNAGSATRNKQLSNERTNTVMYSLAGKGIDIKRLKAKGFGAEKPLKSNDTEENKAANRRVELVKI